MTKQTNKKMRRMLWVSGKVGKLVEGRNHIYMNHLAIIILMLLKQILKLMMGFLPFVSCLFVWFVGWLVFEAVNLYHQLRWNSLLTRLDWISKTFACLCLLSARTKGECHHTWLCRYFF